MDSLTILDRLLDKNGLLHCSLNNLATLLGLLLFERSHSLLCNLISDLELVSLLLDHLLCDFLCIFNFTFGNVLFLERLTSDGLLPLGKCLTADVVFVLHLQLANLILSQQLLLLLKLLRFPNTSLVLPFFLFALVLAFDS